MDFVYDSGRDVIYITTPTAIRRFHVGSKLFLTPFTCGANLCGIDLSPDGNTLVAGENSLLTNQAAVWVVDLPTESVRAMTFDAGWGESGVMWVAFGNDGAALTTSGYAGAGGVPVRRIHPGSNSVSVVGGVTMRTKLSASADGRTVAFTEGYSTDAHLLLYDVGTQTFFKSLVAGGFPDPIRPALSRDGSRVAMATTWSGTTIYDTNLVAVTNFPGQSGGLVYHPTSNMMFVAWSGTREIRAFETDTYSELWRYRFGFGSGVPTGTLMRTSRDGSLVLMLLDGELDYLRWTNAAPLITNSPSGYSVLVGMDVTFTVGACGVPPLSYQWRFEGQDIADATGTSLALHNVQFTNTGTYDVVVFGPNSSTVSTPAGMTVNGPPQITVQPQGLTVPAGTNAAMTVSAIGPQPFSYVWRFGGSAFGAPNAATLILTNVQAYNAGDYSVVLSNAWGYSTSQVATVVVTAAPPFLVQQPESLTAPAGTNVAFSISARGTDPLSYQWYLNSTPLSGRTDAVLSLTNIQNANVGSYTVVVTNAVGTNLSEAAALAVTPAAPRFVIQPHDITATKAAEVTFTAQAVGSEPIGYAWRFEGSEIHGADAAVYTFTNAQATNVGHYNVVVTNTYGSATSSLASLTITPPPGWLWARGSGGTDFDQGTCVATDAAGNVYVAGYFSGQASFGGSNIVSTGANDLFVARYDPAGKLAWLQQGNSPYIDVVNCLAVDGTGNLFIAGYFNTTFTFGGVTLTNSGYPDIFLARLDLVGNVLWVTNAGGNSTDTPFGIAVDNATNVYLAGSFISTATFGAVSITSTAAKDIFLARYDGNGNCVWAKRAGGTSDDEAYAVSCDSAGNPSIAGYFQSLTANFGGLSLTNVNWPSVRADAFFAKYDSSGNSLWVRRAGGVGPNYGFAVRADAVGGIYVAGTYSGTGRFGGETVSSAGTFDAFLAKCDSEGTVKWVRSAGGIGTDMAKALALDAGGNVYVAGYFSRTSNFGGLQLVSNGSEDVFAAMYTPTGDLRWVRGAGSIAADHGDGVAVAGGGNVYITGYDSDPLTFGHAELDNAGYFDFFLAKLAAYDTEQPPVLVANPSSQSVVAGANFTLSTGVETVNPFTAQWRLNGMDLLGATNLWLTISNANTSQGGAYTLVVSNANGAVTSAVATVSVAVEPDFLWAQHGGGPTNDCGLATVVDASGAVYIAGWFTGQANFSGRWYTSYGGEDIIVAKYTGTGFPLWQKQFGALGNDRATALALVPGGGVALAGTYSGSLSMGATTLPPSGRSDVFLARMDGNGAVQWAVRGGGANEDVALAVAVSPVANNFYITGWFQTNAVFGTTTLTDTTATNKFFIAKYDSSGNFGWAATSTGTGPSQGRALACDAGNFVYAGGCYSGPASFGGSSIASTGTLSGFVVKYSSGGNTAAWARKFGSTTNTPTFDCHVNSLALDTNNNLLVAGDFQGSVSFVTTNSTSSLNTNATDGFLLKLDNNGTSRWVRQVAGVGADAANGVAVDSLGGAYLTGFFSNSASIGLNTLNGAGRSDMFVTLFDSTGTLVKARRAGGSEDDAGQSVVTDGRGNVFVGGWHSAPAAFGTNTLATEGRMDAFVTRLSFFPEIAPPQITSQPRSQTVALSSNATFSVGALSSMLPVTYRWQFNGSYLSGATTNAYTVANAQLANCGSYTVVVGNPAGSVTSAVATLTLEQVPEYLWLRRSGSTGDDQGLAVAVDALNYVYVAGLFTGTNAALGNLVSAGGADVYLAKYAPDGTLVWAQRAGGSYADGAQAVRVDRRGNVYVSGYFYSSTAMFGGITVTNKSSPAAAFADLFLAKYDANGNVLWVKAASGSGSDFATALVLDDTGNAYVTGSFHHGAVFGGIMLTNAFSTNFFVAKYASDGNVLWARTTSGTNYSQGNSIAVDAATNVYVTGFLWGTLNLGSGVITNTNGFFSSPTVFLAKYDRDGGLQWVRKGAGNGAGYGQALAVDKTGSVFATSYIRSYGTGLFLAKYDSDGNVLWYHTDSLSCCTGDYTSAGALALDAFGNPLIAGTGNGSIEGITNYFNGGYVLKYRSDGSGYWFQQCASYPAKPPGGPAAMAVDSANNILIAGTFLGTSYFGTTSNLVSAGGNDSFLVKLGARPPVFTQARSNLLIAEGATTILRANGLSGTGPFSYQWRLNDANIAGANGSLLALSNFDFDRAGRYSVVVSGPGGALTGQVAAVGFIPVLSAVPDGQNVTLTWNGTFMLQSATNVTGPYLDLPTVLSPFTNEVTSEGPQRFFRLRVGNPLLAGAMQGNEFLVNLAGSPGRLYEVQVSSNLLQWLPLHTNASPFVAKDPAVAAWPQRFYRAVLLP